MPGTVSSSAQTGAQSVSSVYADYNATSPLRPAAREAMLDALDAVGNPSSIHAHGRAARARIEAARAAIIAALGLEGYRLVFTSGASEALTTVLRPSVQNLQTRREASHLLIAPTEHVAALDGHGFAADRTTHIAVDGDGIVDIGALETELKALSEVAPDQSAQAMVCVQGANSETGALQPLEALSAACDVHQMLLVSDVVQGAGRVALGNARPAAVIVSSHKVGGPAGIGAILYDPARLLIADPLIRGGGQERGVRAGTENAPAVAGFAAALTEAVRTMDEEQARLAALRDGFETALLGVRPDTMIFAQGARRLANTSCFALPGVEASLALMQLDLAGVSISSGSACSSGKVKASHVLAAMGVDPDLAGCALRVSFGFASEAADAERVGEALKRL